MNTKVRRQPRRKVTATEVQAEPVKWGRVSALVALWFVSVSSAMALVYSTYLSRNLTENLEALRRENSQLRVFAGQLQLERSSWAAYSRIEQIAGDDLAMALPQSEETILIMRPQ